MFVFRMRNALYAHIFRSLMARKFAGFGKGTKVLMSEGVEGAENISIGKNVLIAAHTYMAARSLDLGKSVSLSIGDGTRIGRYNHIYATSRIEIGSRVLTANNVYISDNSHQYKDPKKPIFDQPLIQLNEVSIGSGTWVGHGAVIIGAHIGRNCVIGAGAVVLEDIPDNCVVVGAPAYIIKRYDFHKEIWRRTDSNGEFTIAIT